MIHDPRKCRVLVVEDEYLIAMLVRDALSDLGCEVVGPEGGLAAAMLLARDEDLDAAILDVTIRGGQSFPVAKLLRARGVPFLLASGYGDWVLPAEFQDQPRLTKPFGSSDLQQAMSELGVPH